MAAVDLATPAEVREFMQIPATETEQDAITAALVTSASRAIMRYTEREFAPQRSATARDFEYDFSDFLDLAPYDLAAFTSAETSDDDGQTWTAVDRELVRLYPRPARDGVYTALRFVRLYGLPPGDLAHWRWHRHRRHVLVRVTGDWGWPAIPEDVNMACRITVAVWLRRDVSAFSTTFSIAEDRLERPEALPSAVRGMLAPYRRGIE